jgi:pimeloyl-ACP methyl ester carboxylesterase
MTRPRHLSAIEPIKVRRYGNKGPYVVLLHGGPGAPGEMAPVARRLEDRFNIIEPLQRTSGELPLTVDRHVLDLHDVVQAALKKGPVRIVGFSWGAMLGLTYAARFPEGVHSLILIGCGTFNLSSRRVYQNNMKQQLTPELEVRMNQINDQLAIEKNHACRNVLFAEFGTLYTRLQSFNADSSIPEDVLYYDEAGFRETWEDVLVLQEKKVQPNEFKQIRCPVTMIHGKNDPHPGSFIYQSLKPFVRNIKYVAIPQCGHKPWIERMAKDHFFRQLGASLD